MALSLLRTAAFVLVGISLSFTGCFDTAEKAQKKEVRKILQLAFQAVSDIQQDEWKDSAMLELVGVQAETGDFAAALETARHITDGTNRAKAFALIGAGELRAGDAAAAASTFEKAFTNLPDSPSGRLALRELILIRAKAGDVKGALNDAATLTGASERATFLYRIALARIEAGNKPEARAFLQRALAAIADVESRDEKERMLSIIAAGQAKLGDVDDAIGTTQTTLRCIFKADALAMIAEVQARRGSISEAFRTVAECPDAWQTAKALQKIAGVQAKTGDIKGALETAARIKEKAQQARALALAGVAIAKTGDLNTAQQLFHQAESLADDTRHDYYVREKAQVLSDIASARAEAGDKDGAAETFAEAQRFAGFGFHGQAALLVILKSQAESGDLSGALKYALNLRDPRFRASVLRIIAKLQARKGNAPEALRWTQEQTQPYVKTLAFIGIAEGLLTQVLDTESR